MLPPWLFGELAEELPRFELSRELFLLDGWLGIVLFAKDLGGSLLLSECPTYVDDCRLVVGVVGDVALAAAETPDEIDPLAVCVEVGVE